jgi:hypothetical protein
VTHAALATAPLLFLPPLPHPTRHPSPTPPLSLLHPLPPQPPKPEGWEKRFIPEDSWSLRAQLFKLAASAWAAGVTPQGLIRALGPWGPGLVEKYVTGRFSRHGEGLRGVGFGGRGERGGGGRGEGGR